MTENPKIKLNGDDFFLYNFCWKKLSLDSMLSKNEKFDYRGKIHEFVQHLLDEGKEFERKVVSELEKKSDVTVISGKGEEHKYELTLKAMREGAKIIYHGTIKDDERNLEGVPDLLIRSDEGKSKFGKYQYHPADIKMSHDPKGEQILQVVLYKEILKRMQDANPTNAYLYSQSREGEEIYDIYAFKEKDLEGLQTEHDKKNTLLKKARKDLKDIETLTIDLKNKYTNKVSDYYDRRKEYKKKWFSALERLDKHEGIVKELKNRLDMVKDSEVIEAKFSETLKEITEIATGTKIVTPTITSDCKMCDYMKECYNWAEKKRDVSLVAGTGRTAKRNLVSKGINTIEDLVEVKDISKLVAYRFTEKMISGLKTNALGWYQDRLLTHLDNEEIVLYGGAPLEKVILKKSKVEMQIDFEADEKTGNIVMIGINVNEGKKNYAQTFFAETANNEVQMLKDFMHYMEKVDNDVTLYHYSAYEKAHFNNMFRKHYKELYQEFGNKYFDIEDKIMDNLVDLYPIAMSAFAGPIHSYSIKTLLPKVFGFKWREDESIGKVDGAKFEVLYTKYQNLAAGEEKEHIKKVMFEYNQDDNIGPWSIVNKIREVAKKK